jgi:hypothetical protein
MISRCHIRFVYSTDVLARVVSFRTHAGLIGLVRDAYTCNHKFMLSDVNNTLHATITMAGWLATTKM